MNKINLKKSQVRMSLSETKKEDTSYLIQNNNLNEKQLLIAKRLIEQMTNDEERKKAISFIIDNYHKPVVKEILLAIKPQLYSQFLSMDDTEEFDNVLYIIGVLAPDQDFINHFMKYDISILNTMGNLLSHQKDMNQFSRVVGILKYFFDLTDNPEVLNNFLISLLHANAYGKMRSVIMLLIMNLLRTQTSIDIFIQHSGMEMLKDALNSTNQPEIVGGLKMIQKISSLHPEGKPILFKEGICTSLKNCIDRIEEKRLIEEIIELLSIFSTCETFATVSIECGLFAELLELIQYPFKEKVSEKAFEGAMIILFRIFKDDSIIEICKSLKLTSTLCNLLKSIGKFIPTHQLMVIGIFKKLFESDDGRRQMIRSGIDKEIKEIDLTNVHQKVVPIINHFIETFEQMEKQTEEIEYTPEEIQIIADYESKKYKAKSIIEEIVQTELNFANMLTQCCREVIKKLEPILKEKTLTVFVNMNELEFFHVRLASELEKAMKKDIEAKREFISISSVFLRYFNERMLEIHSKFAIGADDGISLFSELSKTNNEVIMAVKVLNLKSMSVSNYLIQPIQRIPRYCLLLESLVKCMPKYLEETKQLEICLQKIKQIAKEINEKKREHEQMVGKSRWLNRIDLSVHRNPQRKYIYEASQVLMTNHVKKTRLVTVVLFDDIVVFAKNVGKKDKEKWKIKDLYQLKEYKMRPIENKQLTLVNLMNLQQAQLSCDKEKDTEYLAEQFKLVFKDLDATMKRSTTMPNLRSTVSVFN